MTVDQFLEDIKRLGCLLSNFYQADDGTWFVAVRTYKPEWRVFYGRNKDLEECLAQALRYAKRGEANWPVELKKKPASFFDKSTQERKKVVERIRSKKKIERIRAKK